MANLLKLLKKETKLIELLDYDWKINHCGIDDDDTQHEYNTKFSELIVVKRKIVKEMKKEIKSRKEILKRH